jgi:DNA-directed RNA polymerase specialized sigma subunit
LILLEKSDLKSYRALMREVQQIRDQLRVLETSLYSPKGQRFSSTPRAASGPKKTMDDAVAGHIKLEALYRSQLAEKENRQYCIEWAITTNLDTPERLVMRFRYIEGRGWPAVVREMEKLGYSERTVYRLHGSALLKLKEF